MYPHQKAHQFQWDDALTCKPLDTLSEIENFVSDPPAWRSLCKDLTPHSKYRIMNLDINKRDDTYLESPESFCHFNPDVDEPRRQIGTSLPKVLVCHDMANGYHDDSYIEGTANHEAYTFYNWTGIDIFCYFSHHLITVPPLGWINVAHDHGVKVIGTVITEWAEGIDFWDNVLSSEEKYKNFASALVAIAKTLKFEGWLLNVENKISKPEVLLEFVKNLHQLLHKEIPNAELIWYDSVTVHGTLNWQNGLNEKNRAFFDACDGLFTNYSWSDEELWSSVEEAGDRLLDLYIGVDVWGRNFFGGGQFNTFEAIKLISQYRCSMAIFAPAWTLEAMSTDKNDLNAVMVSDELDSWQQFLLRDRALWGSFWPFLNTRLPCRLPFHTAFCKGQGSKRWLLGEVVSPGPWYNLRNQHYQANSSHGPHRYLLSLVDDVYSQPYHKKHKDNKGIMLHRDSFNKSRLRLFSTDKDSKGPEPLSENDEEEEAGAEKKLKQKPSLKKSIRQFFRRKSSDGATNQEDRDESMAAGPSMIPSSGKSMVTMSVNLHLGRFSGAKHKFLLSCVQEEQECLEEYRDDAFIGGSCLRIHPSDAVSYEHRTIRLFHCDFPCDDALIVCVVSKPVPGYESQRLTLRLRMRTARGEGAECVVGGEGGAPLDRAGPRFQEVQRFLLLHEPAVYVPVENAYGWHVRYYEVRMPSSRVTSINVRTGLELGPILLGYIGLCPIHSVSNILPTDTSHSE